MKFFSLPRAIAALVAGACLIAPATSYADRKIKVYRDLDGDGHFNKKTYEVPSRRGYYGYNHGYNHGYYGHSRYYGRPYYYDYGYSSPYYRPYFYGPSIGFSFYSSPSSSYYEDGYAYRDAPRAAVSDEGSLVADVQQELKRRGYYKGGIDGDIGPASRSAIRAFQSEKGLTVTGRIDRSLLRALGIG